MCDPCLLGSTEDLLVLLLGLLEGLLEEVGIWKTKVSNGPQDIANLNRSNSLSLLAKRMARVCFSGSPSETSAVVFQTQLRSLPTLGLNFISGTTKRVYCQKGHPESQGIFPGILTIVVGADLEGLVPTHDQTSLPVLLVLQQTNITGTTLLPLLALGVELEELGAHLENLLLQLLVGLDLNHILQLRLHPAGIGNDLDTRENAVRESTSKKKSLRMG